MKKINLGLSSAEFKKVRSNLHNFFTEFPSQFKRLFQKNELIEYEGSYLNSLLEIGIVSKVEDTWSSNYSIYEFEEQYFLTDSFLLPQTERVFPLSQDESLFLAGKLNVKSSDKVLDIGTGSGIYAIVAAKKGATVVAVDINDKALNYAQFNASLNGVEHKIEFLSSDVFANLGNAKFNLIISNPAIIPTAEDSAFYIHSDGGIDGTRMSFKILENFSDHLLAGGKLQILATSFSTKSSRMLVEDFISDHYSNKAYKFTIQELYTPCLDTLSSLTNHFVSNKNYHTLVNRFTEHEYSSLRYLYIIAEEGSPFVISRVEQAADFEINDYNGSWQGRLARLFMVYPKIAIRKIREKVID